MKILKTLRPACAGLALASVAQAQLLVGTSSYSTGETHSVDPATGVASGFALVHPTTGTQVPCAGMAADDVNRVLYVSDTPVSGNDAELLSQGYDDATATILSPFGAPIVDTVSGFPIRCEALAFGNGTLYAVHQIFNGLAPEGIYSIDLAASPVSATLVHAFQDDSIDIGGLGFDPLTNLFYGSNDGPGYPGGPGLVVFDVALGTETLVASYPPGVADVDGVAVDPASTVWLVEDQAGDTIHPFDLATGAFLPSLTSPIQLTWLFSAGAWAPGFGPGGPGPIGTAYCSPANPNSTGASGVISAFGETLVAANDVVLTADQLPPGQFGYFLAGQAQGAFMPGGSQGVICMTGNIGRYNQIANLIQGPTGSIPIDLTSIPVNPPTAVVPGDTWNFQCWYRDNNPAVTSNFTDGLTVVFE